MTIDIQDDNEEDEDDETKAKKEAAISAELSRILAKHTKDDKKLTKYEWTRKNWIYIGSDLGLDFFVGSIRVETMYKFPKTFRGKVALYDEYIRIFRDEILVYSHKIEYVNGFRGNYQSEMVKAIENMGNKDNT